MDENDHKFWLQNSQYLTVYLLPFFEIKRDQAEFCIRYATFDPLQNGKKILKKKGNPRADIGPILAVIRWEAS